MVQAWVIAQSKVGESLTLYTILGGGLNVANVELGLSYQMRPECEITASYRHLTVEKFARGHGNMNMRGFWLGLTWKNYVTFFRAPDVQVQEAKWSMKDATEFKTAR